MHKRFIPWFFLTVFIAFVLGYFASATAKADTYTDNLVGGFTPGQHVIVDPDARPKLGNADEINRQILDTHRPIWVANVAKDETNIATPDAIKDAMARRNGGFSGIILVIDGKGYHVRAYDVPWGVANQSGDLLNRARDSHRNDLPGTVSALVSSLNNATLWDTSITPPPAPAPEPSKPVDWGFLWFFFWLAIGGVALYGSYLVVRTVGDRRAAKRREREAVNSEIISCESAVQDLSEQVLLGLDVGDQYSKANVALGDAKGAWDKGDYSGARAHLVNVRDYLGKADKAINPRTNPNLAAIKGTPKRQRKVASIKVTSPAGETHRMSNTQYKTHRDRQHPYYFAGGEMNGAFFYPGWYPYPFWLSTWNWDTGSNVYHDDHLTDSWGGIYESQPKYTSPSTSSAGWGSSDDSGSSRHTSSTHSAGFSSGSSSSGSSSSRSSYTSSSSSSDSGSSSYSSPSISFDFGGGGGGYSGGGDAGF